MTLDIGLELSISTVASGTCFTFQRLSPFVSEISQVSHWIGMSVQYHQHTKSHQTEPFKWAELGSQKMASWAS